MGRGVPGRSKAKRAGPEKRGPSSALLMTSDISIGSFVKQAVTVVEPCRHTLREQSGAGKVVKRSRVIGASVEAWTI